MKLLLCMYLSCLQDLSKTWMLIPLQLLLNLNDQGTTRTTSGGIRMVTDES